MIEANNPEINVDELMDKIRAEVAMRQSFVSTSWISSILNLKNTGDFSHIEGLVNTAESRSYVRTKWPDKLNRFPFNISKKIQKLALKVLEILFIDQREVNFNLLKALRESLLVNRQLIEQIVTLQAQFSATDNRVNAIDERVSATDNRVNAIDERVSATDNRVNAIEERVSAIDNRVNAIDERVSATDNCVNAIDERVSATDNCVNAIDERVSAMDERHIRDDSYLKNDLAQQKRLITLFLEEARQRLPEPFNQEQLQTLVNEEQHLLDAFYVAFEDRFRGSREEIIDRLKVYLPLIQEAKVGTHDSPILDVGCGRGEWLELLREAGYIARGLDINRVMIDQCQTRGLEVIEGDVISYLQTLPDANLGAVTGFHIVEHLPLSVLMKFVTETIRVLKPGGLAILETPNPKNLVVGACNFYSDPTHRNPIFPETIQFIVEYQGLLNVKIMYLNPVEVSPLDKEDIGSQLLHNWFFGPRDYAVVGHKV